MDFPLPEREYKFRPLRLLDPMLEGWDVLAIQTVLIYLGYAPGVPDGKYGPKTGQAIHRYQGEAHLLVDDICGGATMRSLAMKALNRTTARYHIERGLMHGQVEHESSLLPPNFSAKRSDGSRDCGIVQMNDAHTPHGKSFDSGYAIDALGRHLRDYFEKYDAMDGITTDRAWELACGSWNAPAWTDRLAEGETLTPAAQAHIDAYILDCTGYVR